MLQESDAFDLYIDGDPPAFLGDLPLLVITRGRSEASVAIPAEEREQIRQSEEIHEELQRELASLSTRGRLIVATESGHGIHADQPELVIESLRELVEVVRADGSHQGG